MFRLRVVILFTRLKKVSVAVGFVLALKLEYFGDKLESLRCQWIYINDLPALGYLCCEQINDEKR